jgi:tetratricopeptide (TPR) repeat protein
MRRMREDRWRVGWRVCLGLLATVVVVAEPSAIYMRVDVDTVAAARLIGNLEKIVAKDPKDVANRVNLARAHAMAYAMRSDSIEVRKGAEPVEVWFGYDPPNVPFDSAKAVDRISTEEAEAHLAKAIAVYREVVALAPDAVTARLGLGWCLDRAGQKAEAISVYRKVVADAWTTEQEQKIRFVGRPSIVAEAAGYLIPLLRPKEDQAEIAELRSRIDIVNKRPRAITPIVIPLRDGLTPTDLADHTARVRFDADGSGWKKLWTWITPDAGWLVHAPRADKPIRSALQMFGSVTFWMFWENGYHALRALDDDDDGMLRRGELVDLAIWHDANRNAVAEPGEVTPLAAWDIVALNVSYRPGAPGSDVIAFSPQGVVFRDGRTRPSYDVLLYPAGRTESTDAVVGDPKTAAEPAAAERSTSGCERFASCRQRDDRPQSHSSGRGCSPLDLAACRS